TSGTRLCDELSVFHDADTPALRIDRIAPAGDAPFLRLTCYRFEGTFLSLALAIPESLSTRMRAGHELILDVTANSSRPVALDTRLNISIAGEMEELFSHRILTKGTRRIRYDLQHFDLRDETVGNAWCDLIFKHPAMIEIDLIDVVLALKQRDAA
ncbi:MAG: DUF6478 family protein, partial [Pseudomonadota bacterium]